MELCCVAARHSPAYGIGVLLPDMLSIELSGWDALMIGLRALLTMLIAAPSWSKGNQQPTFQACSAPLANCRSSSHILARAEQKNLMLPFMILTLKLQSALR